MAARAPDPAATPGIPKDTPGTKVAQSTPGTLPRTGLDVGLEALMAAVMLGAGATLRTRRADTR